LSDDATFSFAEAIHDHLELKRQNAALEFDMPLARYLSVLTSQTVPRVEDDVGIDEEDTLANVAWPE
jgi:hypothetical protein